MSRGGAKAARAAREDDRANARADAELCRIEAHAAVDAVLARCVACGLEQVASGTPGHEVLPTDRCFLCGGRIGAFVEFLPGHPSHAVTAEATEVSGQRERT